MKRAYLGDTYDAVKRLWNQAIGDWAPLYAEAKFIPTDIRHDFTRLTGIPMLPEIAPISYSLLNDPDTGIRLPEESNQGESQAHITLATIRAQLHRHGPRAVITFDQSDYRHGELNRENQRQAKMRYLAEAGLCGFYYVSHAPFLFAFADVQNRLELRERFRQFGVPDDRFEIHK